MMQTTEDKFTVIESNVMCRYEFGRYFPIRKVNNGIVLNDDYRKYYQKDIEYAEKLKDVFYLFTINGFVLFCYDKVIFHQSIVRKHNRFNRLDVRFSFVFEAKNNDFQKGYLFFKNNDSALYFYDVSYIFQHYDKGRFFDRLMRGFFCVPLIYTRRRGRGSSSRCLSG